MSIDSRYSIGDNRRGYGEGGERVRRRWEERERVFIPSFKSSN